MAGSMPSCFSVTGIKAPETAAIIRFMAMARPMITPRETSLNQSTAITDTTQAQISPLRIPMAPSLNINDRAFALLRCPRANPRIEMVRVWLPAIPPMLATMGMSTARATNCLMVSSKRPITHEARRAVSRFIPSQTARRRAVWLGINLLTALLASWVIGRFEDTIRQLVALAVLMPIVASMGGIAGSQTLTISIRGLALGHLSRANARSLMFKEGAIGILNGLIWACVVSVIAVLWFKDVSLGVIIGLAMAINLIIAAVSGALIPVTLKQLGIDPAIAGGVVLTTVTDVVGFMTFLGLATLFLVPH